MQGQLFTHYFLTDGIRTTPEWMTSIEDQKEFESFRKEISGLFDSFSSYSDPNEAVSEQDLIRPILELLGWTAYMPQQGSARNEDIPDHLMFGDETAYGDFRTKRLILAYMNALAAGDSETVVNL